jgi:hypothetical protein
MSSPARKLEVAANVALIAATVVVGGVLLKKHVFPGAPARPARIQPGERIQLPGVDWSAAQHTAVVVLQAGCHFCSESAPFYARLAAAAAARRPAVALVAVMPHDPAQGRSYLDAQKVPIPHLVQARPGSIKVRGTPTILLVDQRGVVTRAWFGKLPPDKEREVLGALGG